MGVARITRARPRDALALHALHRAVLAEGRWYITHPDELTGSVEEREQLLAALVDADNAVALVARVGRGQIAGSLTLVGGTLRRMRHTARLEVMVAKPWRGQGIGRQLVEAGIAWAIDNPQLEKLGLSVFADNERAIALYRSVGFAVEGRREREYRMADGTYRDDVLMFLDVSARPTGESGA